MKYAIIQVSGTQRVITPEKWYDIGFINTGKVGDFVVLKKILLLCNNNKIQLGAPFLGNSRILAQIVQRGKRNKITVCKTRPKKNYTRMHGHRECYTRIKIS